MKQTNLSDEEKVKGYEHMIEQRRKYTQRRLIKISLLEKKCKEKGIVVTDKEIDDELKRRNKK